VKEVALRRAPTAGGLARKVDFDGAHFSCVSRGGEGTTAGSSQRTPNIRKRQLYGRQVSGEHHNDCSGHLIVFVVKLVPDHNDLIPCEADWSDPLECHWGKSLCVTDGLANDPDSISAGIDQYRIVGELAFANIQQPSFEQIDRIKRVDHSLLRLELSAVQSKNPSRMAESITSGNAVTSVMASMTTSGKRRWASMMKPMAGKSLAEVSTRTRRSKSLSSRSSPLAAEPNTRTPTKPRSSASCLSSSRCNASASDGLISVY
jgi:hypothetical protein